MTAPVVIRRRHDRQYLTHLISGHARFGAGKPAPFRSAGSAEALLRIDLGEDLADFEILPADQLRAIQDGK